MTSRLQSTPLGGASLSVCIRQTKSQHLSHAIRILTAVGVMITSGCSTVFVRSESTVNPEHVFPATAFDAQFLWQNGVKGEPLFATVDPKERGSPAARSAYVVGAILDLPFSVAFDTILLPVDLTRSRAPGKSGDAKGEPKGPANRSQPIHPETNRTPSAAGSRR